MSFAGLKFRPRLSPIHSTVKICFRRYSFNSKMSKKKGWRENHNLLGFCTNGEILIFSGRPHWKLDEIKQPYFSLLVTLFFFFNSKEISCNRERIGSLKKYLCICKGIWIQILSDFRLFSFSLSFVLTTYACIHVKPLQSCLTLATLWI